MQVLTYTTAWLLKKSDYQNPTSENLFRTKDFPQIYINFLKVIFYTPNLFSNRYPTRITFKSRVGKPIKWFHTWSFEMLK